MTVHILFSWNYKDLKFKFTVLSTVCLNYKYLAVRPTEFSEINQAKICPAVVLNCFFWTFV